MRLDRPSHTDVGVKVSNRLSSNSGGRQADRPLQRHCDRDAGLPAAADRHVDPVGIIGTFVAMVTTAFSGP